MVLYSIVSAIYAGILLFYKPSPPSLKAQPLSFSENFHSIKASLFTGLLILTVFLFTSGFEFIVTDEKFYDLLALNNYQERPDYWPIQVITHLFIHINLYHVVANVFVLGIASAYERRVGSKRFIFVLTVASVASIPSILFYPENITVCGISGGVFGLAVAYFTDHEGMTTKEWFYTILVAIFLISIFTLQGELESGSSSNLDFKVDHIAHIMGALSAIIYCRLTSNYIAKNSS